MDTWCKIGSQLKFNFISNEFSLSFDFKHILEGK